MKKIGIIVLCILLIFNSAFVVIAENAEGYIQESTQKEVAQSESIVTWSTPVTESYWTNHTMTVYNIYPILTEKKLFTTPNETWVDTLVNGTSTAYNLGVGFYNYLSNLGSLLTGKEAERLQELNITMPVKNNDILLTINLTFETIIEQVGQANITYVTGGGGNTSVLNATLDSSHDNYTVKMKPYFDITVIRRDNLTHKLIQQHPLPHLPVPTSEDVDGDNSGVDLQPSLIDGLTALAGDIELTEIENNRIYFWDNWRVMNYTSPHVVNRTG